MSTRLKVMSGMTVILVIVAAIIGLSMYAINNLEKVSHEVSGNLEQQVFYLSRTIDHLKWDKNLSELIFQGRNVAVQEDPRLCNLGKWFYTYVGTDEFRRLPKEIQDNLRSLEKPHQALHGTATEIMALLKKGDKAGAARVYMDKTMKSLEDTQGIIFSLNDKIDKMAHDKGKSVDNELSRTKVIVSIALVAGAVIFGLVGFVIFRALGVLQKLKPFNEIFSSAAMGDLTVRYPVKKVNCSSIMQCGKNSCPDYGKDSVLCWFDVGSYAPDFNKEIHCPKILNKVYKSCSECRVYKMVNTDEVAVLGAWFNKYIDILDDLVSNINASAVNINQAAQEINSGNQNLSQRTSEQASALEEVASTIEEAIATISQNADNSVLARELTDQGTSRSSEGNRVAGEAVLAINEMNDSSKRIGEIISLINDIAFQTNLLALNAAVEAARAGEQGRGFAVVAGEVRNLAQRSGDAAKEIEVLIKDSMHKVERGTDLVTKTGDVLSEISGAAQRTAQLISEIAVANQEQKQGISQIQTALNEMDTMTQQNASLVEETASASEEMSGQMIELVHMVKRFKTQRSDRDISISSGAGDGKDKKEKQVKLSAEEAVIAGRSKKDNPGGTKIKDVLIAEGFEEF